MELYQKKIELTNQLGDHILKGSAVVVQVSNGGGVA
jgi:hypothetical protein